MPGGAVAAIVLAAGSSTRMGRNKMLLDVGQEPLVRRSVRAALDAGPSPVILVLGHEAERVRAAVAGLACRVVLNAEHAQGQRGSLQAGLLSVPPDACAVVVTLGDMPFVTAAMIRTLVERFRQQDVPLVVSEYGDVIAPPTLYHRSLFPDLLAMTGEGGGKEVALRHRHAAAVVAWPREALADVDVPEDYERVVAQRVE